ncbi:MAG: hypothetical protein ABI193_02545 [Minicystis sp.]
MKARGVGIVAACVLAVLPRSAEALEVSGGVSVGGIMAGVVPRFALSPHVGLSWRTESGFLFEVHELASILPLRGVGVFSATSIAIGYASERATFSAGPSLAAYSMTACGDVVCGRLVGLAPGGHAAATFYFAGPLGVTINANATWVGGDSLVLPGGVAVMIVAGPVLRWRSE